ncbi:MAG: hypothetical protein ACYDB9_09760 [Gammaproteobacteria bacterium]
MNTPSPLTTMDKLKRHWAKEKWWYVAAFGLAVVIDLAGGNIAGGIIFLALIRIIVWPLISSSRSAFNKTFGSSEKPASSVPAKETPVTDPVGGSGPKPAATGASESHAAQGDSAAPKSPQGLSDWQGLRTPDGKVVLRCPQTWKKTTPLSGGACLALRDAAGSVLMEVAVADAEPQAVIQPTDVGTLTQIAEVAINGLREEHQEFVVLSAPAQMPDWTDGVCLHFMTRYLEAVVLGKRLSSITDSYLIGKGTRFVSLNIKCEEFRFKSMVPVNASIARSVTLLSGAA